MTSRGLLGAGHARGTARSLTLPRTHRVSARQSTGGIVLHTSRRTRVLAALSVISLVAVASCGDDDDNATKTTTGGSAAVTTPSSGSSASSGESTPSSGSGAETGGSTPATISSGERTPKDPPNPVQ